MDENQNQISRNIYWFPNEKGEYSGLNNMKSATVDFKAKRISNDRIEVSITNAKGNPVAFFNRISLINAQTKERILPAFYDDNYLSVLPGETIAVTVDYVPEKGVTPNVTLEGWNVDKKEVKVQ